MNIVIYRKSPPDITKLFKEIIKELNDRKIKFRGVLNGYIIVKQRINISFFCNDVCRMGGIRPDYYNTDTTEASEFLKQGASKVNGHEISTLKDLLDIIIKI